MATAWDVIHSSKDMAWRTPPEIFDPLNNEFNFCIDAAASEENSLCLVHFSEEDSAFRDLPWIMSVPDGCAPTVFCNPPYGRAVGRWVQRAYEESGRGCTVAVLVMACTDTKWWSKWAWKADEIRLVSGRISFLDHSGNRKSAAPKGSAILIFRPPVSGLYNEGPRVRLWHPDNKEGV